VKLNFGRIVEVVFPPSEDEKRISNCEVSSFVCKLNTQKRGDIEGLASFKDPEIRSALHLVKFHNHRKAAILLSALLERRLAALTLSEYILIPIPLSSQRLRERGHNQVATIATGTLRTLPHMHLATDILLKGRNTRPQTTLSKKERETNVVGAFSIKSKNAHKLSGKNIILLDDVTTTGATLKEALAVVSEKGPKSVLCIAVAY
jgi:ComF family protein